MEQLFEREIAGRNESQEVVWSVWDLESSLHSSIDRTGCLSLLMRPAPSAQMSAACFGIDHLQGAWGLQGRMVI